MLPGVAQIPQIHLQADDQKHGSCYDRVYRDMNNQVFHVPCKGHILNMIKNRIRLKTRILVHMEKYSVRCSQFGHQSHGKKAC